MTKRHRKQGKDYIMKVTRIINGVEWTIDQEAVNEVAGNQSTDALKDLEEAVNLLRVSSSVESFTVGQEMIDNAQRDHGIDLVEEATKLITKEKDED